MSTPAQIAANQTNSKLSTGATSEAGKKIVSQNSWKHGLCAKLHIALPGERRRPRRARRRLPSGLRPGRPTRARSGPQYRRKPFQAAACSRAGARLFTQIMLDQSANVDSASADETWAEKTRELKNITLQAGRIQRAIEKSTAALNAMQAHRKAAYTKAEAEAILLTQLAHAKGQTVDAAKDFPSPEHCGGFVYSLPEIARLIGRAARLAEANARFLVLPNVAVDPAASEQSTSPDP